MHRQQVGLIHAECDRREVALDVRFSVRDARNQLAGPANHQRITIRRGTHDMLAADGAGSARAVVYDDLLSERRRHTAREETRESIGPTARRERHDESNRLDGIRGCLCPGGQREQRERNSEDSLHHRAIPYSATSRVQRFTSSTTIALATHA
jgi:hypothetical protein